MNGSRRRWLPLFAAKLLLSAALLTWLLTRPGMEDFPRLVMSADLRWLWPAFLCGALTVVMSAWRWQLCLRAVGIRIPFRETLRITLAANATGYFSIGTLGNDATRILLVTHANDKGPMPAAASLALDHASSVPAMIVLLAAAIIPLGIWPTLKPQALPVLAVSLVAVIGGMIYVRLRWKALHKRILDFLRAGATWRVLAVAAIVSIPVWITFAGIFYCAARGLGHAPPLLSFAGICAIADGVSSLPISVAGLGVREKAFQTLLEISQGIPAAAAVAISLLGFGILLLWAGIGTLCLLAKWPASVKNSA